MKVILVSLLLFLLPGKLFSQSVPNEGSILNYRIAGFSSSEMRTGSYEIKIADGNYTSEDSFGRHIIITQKGSSDKLTIEVPAFGSKYTWQVVQEDGKKGALHHFGTGKVPNVDDRKYRFRIIKQARKYKDGYVFIDGNRVMYDMEGNPVWFLPDKGDFLNEKLELRDMKMTSRGTITFLVYDQAYEINYDGDVLWHGPDDGKVSGGKKEDYHHEFTRLSNGHYMILGDEYSFFVPDSAGRMIWRPRDRLSMDSLDIIRQHLMGTVIEYDEKGNVVWSWHISSYLSGSDLFYHLKQSGKPEPSAHDNSFYYDEEEQMIYISLRNLSRIIKVKYPEGIVVAAYGDKFEKGVPEKYNGMYCKQHACRVSQKGYLYLFNNNSCNQDELPSLVMFRQPEDGNGELKKIWEYKCTLDDDFDVKKYGIQFIMGGNVEELPDRSLFASMGGVYSKIFIVNKRKKILWSGLPEKWDPKQKTWMSSYSYRASLITDKQSLERVIWAGRQM